MDTEAMVKRVAGSSMTAADDYQERLKARFEEMRDIVSEIDQMLSFSDIDDKQSTALTKAANLIDKAKLQLKKAK